MYPLSRTRLSITIFALVAFSLSRPLVGDVPEPGEREAKLCQLVLRSLESTHLLGRPFDDALAHRLFERFLAALDPDRLYFLKADVEEFEAERDTLDDRLAEGRLDFAGRVYGRLLERVETRGPQLMANVAAEHDFDAEDYHFPSRQLAEYPTADDVAELCRKHVKFLLLEKMSSVVGATPREARDAVAEHLSRQHERMRDLDVHRLTATYLSAAAAAYDPHSRYLSPSDLKDLEISITLRLVGIGAYLRTEGGVVLVTKLVAGGAAEKDGRLRPGDRIIAVGQGEKETFSRIRGERLGEVVRMIRGAVGTTVRLLVLHDDDSSELIAIRRAAVELVDSVAKGRTHEITADGKRTLAIGILDLPTFYGPSAASAEASVGRRSATDDVAEILSDFQRRGVDAVVLDLRANFGGLLEEALGVAGLFIDSGPLVQIKGRAGEPRIMFDDRPGMTWEGPLVVLTSRYTASAAEIVAGAIQDYRRGLIVGAPATFGKGTVQSIVPLGDESAGEARGLGGLKVTVSQFYRPLGDSTQERGVTADLELPSADAPRGRREASLPGALAFGRVRSARIERNDFVRPGLTTKLALLSQKRLETSVEFQSIRDDIVRAARFRDRKWVRLRLDEVRALTGGRDANGALLGEALQIVRDYVLALEG